MNLKKAINTLREVESSEGFGLLIREMVDCRLSGLVHLKLEELSDSEKRFLQLYDFTFTYNGTEWEIKLIED